MRKKNEKNFWDMEIIGNRRKISVSIALVQVYNSWKKIYFVHSYKSRIEHSQIVSN